MTNKQQTFTEPREPLWADEFSDPQIRKEYEAYLREQALKELEPIDD